MDAYITAEDVGTTVADMEHVRMETDHVTGISVALGGSGDPSPVTAMGTYEGMKAGARRLWGTESLRPSHHGSRRWSCRLLSRATPSSRGR